jgi:pantoate--beta-alanine ligase
MTRTLASHAGTPTSIRVFAAPDSMRDWSRRVRGAGRCLALVPTMGALHEGHRSLFRAAGEAGDAVAASIFVNPAQFGEGEDFEHYPRQLEADLEICAAEGVEAVYAPARGAVYAPAHSTWIVEEALAAPFEGACRPGHFRGVLTIVLKLFQVVEPDVAVFGQKDLQQALLIRRMVRDLDSPVQIRIAPTIRDADGLALSSRNAYLDADERQRALRLSRALRAAAQRLAAGETDTGRIRQAGRALLEGNGGLDVEYLEVADLETMQTPARVEGPVAIIGAVRVGRTRLIDNVIYPPGALAGLSAGASTS